MTQPQVVSLRTLVNPTPRQDEFLKAVQQYKYVLYGGAAGGGKSYILRWTLLALLLKWAKEGKTGVRVGLFCEDYPSLRERQLSKIRFEFPEWLGRMRESPLPEFVLNPEFGSGVIAFRNLNDPAKYLSAEFAAIAIDELTRNDQTVFDFLRMRMRWTGIDHTLFIAATNPGEIGHAWVKKLWIDRDFPPELADKAHQFHLIKALATDNPHLSPEYIEALKSLPDNLRSAYFEGNWDAFSGQVFSSWRNNVHIEDPWQLPPGTRYFSAMDRGFGAPSAVLLFAVLPQDMGIRIVSEAYGTEWITSDLIGRIKSLGGSVADYIGNVSYGDYCVADPAIWSRNNHTGISEAEEMMKNGINMMKADNERRHGLARVFEWLKHVTDKDGQTDTARLKVWSNCRNLIRTLPALPWDKNTDDVDTHADDHLYDALRYGLMSRPSPAPAPDPKKHRNRHYGEALDQVTAY